MRQAVEAQFDQIIRGESQYCTQKRPHSCEAAFSKFCRRQSESALTCFEPTLRLVDHIDAALAAHDAAITVPVLQRAERVANFHSPSPFVAAREERLRFRFCHISRRKMTVHGGRYWDRTSDPFDVNEVLYR